MVDRLEAAQRLRSGHNRLRLIFSVLGILIGVSVAVVFCVHYRNYNAGLWGLVSAIAAGLALFVTVAYVRQFWDANPIHLKKFMLMGCFIQLLGVAGFTTYIALAVSQSQGLLIYGPGYYIASVWCFMTWKWGFGLFFFSRSFFRQYDLDPLSAKEQNSAYSSTSKAVSPTSAGEE